MEHFNLFHLENTLWCVNSHVGVDTYDFNFEQYFSCRHPLRLDQPVTAIARLGAAQDYELSYNEFRALGILLIHSPAQYSVSSEFPNWYPLISDLTPPSIWFDSPPTADQVEKHFKWPIFVKGHRQTNRHRRDQAIIESREHFDRLMGEWNSTPFLAWQKIICREFMPLRAVAPPDQSSLPKSYEFRTFCWRGRCVGIGRYWISETYGLSKSEERDVSTLAEAAAKRLGLPFVVVDIAQTVNGRWIVIEINDGQDSGYGGVSPMAMWATIIEQERKTNGQHHTGS